MSKENKHPNILFIMDDQHRFDYMGCSGAEFVNTPSIDRLAANGIRFANCFTNSPLCAPARIALATGLQPWRVGSLDNNSFLPVSVPTFYQRFRDHGYRTGCIGKLDLAKPDPYNGRYGDRPCAYGWGFTHPEECEGKMHAGTSPTPIGPYTWYLEEKGLLKKFHEDYMERRKNGWRLGAEHDSVLDTEDFEDIYIGRRAAEWIRDIPDDFPWFYFVSFVGPHDPFDPPAEYADRYREADMPDAIADPLENKPGWIRNRAYSPEPEEIRVTRRQYCGAIEAIDTGIGWMLDALEERGFAENTHIVFTSDHGEMLGDHGLYTKQVAYEPSMHVPLIMAGPGIEAGKTDDSLIELIDCNPTVCELAGVGIEENIDAESFVPVLKGESSARRKDVIAAGRNYRCIRTHEFKFIENYNDINELYDMKADPEELNNLIHDKPDTANTLSMRLKERFAEGAWLR